MLVVVSGIACVVDHSFPASLVQTLVQTLVQIVVQIVVQTLVQIVVQTLVQTLVQTETVQNIVAAHALAVPTNTRSGGHEFFQHCC